MRDQDGIKNRDAVQLLFPRDRAQKLGRMVPLPGCTLQHFWPVTEQLAMLLQKPFQRLVSITINIDVNSCLRD